MESMTADELFQLNEALSEIPKKTRLVDAGWRVRQRHIFSAQTQRLCEIPKKLRFTIKSLQSRTVKGEAKHTFPNSPRRNPMESMIVDGLFQ